MNEQILSLINRLDEALIPLAKEGERFDMFHLGRSALVLHYGFQLSTRDVDIVGMQNRELDQKAIELLGEDSPMARSLGIYLDLVPEALPPLPTGFRKRCRQVPGPWQVIRLWKLEDHDLAASKLKSFRPQDRADLQAMCDRGLLTAGRLRESLEEAFPWRSPKEGDEEDDPDNPDWGKAYASFKRVEDYLNGRISSI